MTIADEITRIKTNISNAYTSCKNKGATLPNDKNSENLATTIDSITSGGGSGDFIGIPREVNENGIYQIPLSSSTFSLPNNATNVGNYALSYAFYNSSGLTNIDLSNLTTISGNNALNCAFSQCSNLTSVDLSGLITISGTNALFRSFSNCSNLTDVDLSNLTTINGSSVMCYAFDSCTNLKNINLNKLTTINGNSAMDYTFYGCRGLISIDLNSLTTIKGSNIMDYAFSNCTGLTSVNFNNLKQIGSDTTTSYDNSQMKNCFYGCSNLTELSFPSLEKIYCTGSDSATSGTFYNNNKIQKMYFPKLNTITYSPACTITNYQKGCDYIFSKCSSLTEIHFGAKNKEAIEATTGYPTLWGLGAGKATVYFDLGNTGGGDSGGDIDPTPDRPGREPTGGSN